MQPYGRGPENAADVGYIRRIDVAASAQLIRGLWQLLRSEGDSCRPRLTTVVPSGIVAVVGSGTRALRARGAWPGRWIWSGVVLISARTHTSAAGLMWRGARGVFLSSGRWGQGRPRRGAWRERRMSVAVPRAASHLAAQGRGAAAGWFRAAVHGNARAVTRTGWLSAACSSGGVPRRRGLQPLHALWLVAESQVTRGGRRGWLPRLCQRGRASPLRASACGGCLRWPSGRCAGRLPGRQDAQGPPTGATGRR